MKFFVFGPSQIRLQLLEPRFSLIKEDIFLWNIGKNLECITLHIEICQKKR